MAGEPLYFGALMWTILCPGQKGAVRFYEKLLDITKRIAASGQGALPDERFRAALWNAPTLPFPELMVWAEQQWGVALLMEMLTYHRPQFIDTKTPDTMIRDLARIIMHSPMSRHARGPVANYYEDLFYLYEYFDLDMIWMGGHIGCKNALATTGILREKCRERGIPLLVIHFDLSDTRVVPPEQIKSQATEFMHNIMLPRRG
jgi:hypothetical protein